MYSWEGAGASCMEPLAIGGAGSFPYATFLDETL